MSAGTRNTLPMTKEAYEDYWRRAREHEAERRRGRISMARVCIEGVLRDYKCLMVGAPRVITTPREEAVEVTFRYRQGPHDMTITAEVEIDSPTFKDDFTRCFLKQMVLMQEKGYATPVDPRVALTEYLLEQGK